MTNLLILLGSIFFVGLALVFIVPLIDGWRANRRQATRPVQEKQLEKAA
jgi:hypothetical protein